MYCPVVTSLAYKFSKRCLRNNRSTSYAGGLNSIPFQRHSTGQRLISSVPPYNIANQGKLKKIMEHTPQGDSRCSIVTYDNRMLKVNKSPAQQFNLKAVSGRSTGKKHACKIIRHKDKTVSLSFHKVSPTVWCYCDPQSKTLQLKSEIVNKDVKSFCFFQRGDSNGRSYFESCAKKGWFIHTAKDVVTIDNDNNKMEAKYFQIKY